jgi:hypothetical protein
LRKRFIECCDLDPFVTSYVGFLGTLYSNVVLIVAQGIVKVSIRQHIVRMIYSLFLELIPLTFSPSAIGFAILIRPALIEYAQVLKPPERT